MFAMPGTNSAVSKSSKWQVIAGHMNH
jgi:hypothetical protein